MLLPFQFGPINGSMLLTNDCGEFIILNQDAFDSFVSENLNTQSDDYLNLKSKFFLCSPHELSSVIDLMAIRLRTKKAHLLDFTALHMIVPTIACNGNCVYCQASSRKDTEAKAIMTRQTADAVVSMIMKSPNEYLKIEFQGGEPLLAFPVVRYIIETSFKQALLHNKRIQYVVCTNLQMVTAKQLKFFKKYQVQISTSLDGPKLLHNLNRPVHSGEDSYELFTENLRLARSILGNESISALLTITRASLSMYKEIVDAYVDLGFHSLFFRCLNPFGRADPMSSISYNVDEFIEDYLNALDYIIDVNMKGYRLVEEFAAILLRKILTPFSTGFVDLQSPAGAGISCALYNYDGEVYASDEGRMLHEMGDDAFRLGSVRTDQYQDIFNSASIHNIIADSVAESSLDCAYCVFLPYCGTDPVRNWLNGKSFAKTCCNDERCRRLRSTFERLFALLGDQDAFPVLLDWSCT